MIHVADEIVLAQFHDARFQTMRVLPLEGEALSDVHLRWFLSAIAAIPISAKVPATTRTMSPSIFNMSAITASFTGVSPSSGP